MSEEPACAHSSEQRRDSRVYHFWDGDRLILRHEFFCGACRALVQKDADTGVRPVYPEIMP